MTGRNVNYVAERFGTNTVVNDFTVGAKAEFDERGRLYVQMACAKCYGWANPADIKGGNLPCPNGHAASWW